MGTPVQLTLEAAADEAARVAEFFATIVRAVHLGQLSLDAGDKSALAIVNQGTLAFPFTANMPMRVTMESVRTAILDAHRLRLTVVEKTGTPAIDAYTNSDFRADADVDRPGPAMVQQDRRRFSRSRPATKRGLL